MLRADNTALSIQAGNSYGATYSGGAHNQGCVFKLTRTATGGYTERVIHSFGGASTEGKYPLTGVTLDTAGNLYGTTSEGGENYGTVYQLVPSSGGYTEKMLYFFTGGADGANPFGGVILDPSGNLYGSTENGGSSGAGTAFKLTKVNGNWSYTALYHFAGVSEPFCGPYGNLARDGKGNLYGTTYCSGGFGDVFKLTPGGTYTSLRYFTGGSDGANPISNVTFDASGNLYGTASQRANTTCDGGCGVVWKITP